MLSIAEAATLKTEKKKRKWRKRKRKEGNRQLLLQDSAAPQGKPSRPWLRFWAPWALPGQLMEPQESFWAQVWRDRTAPKPVSLQPLAPWASERCQRWDTLALEAGSWTGDNDADADGRMQGGTGQASARRRQGEKAGKGEEGSWRGPAQAAPGSRAPDRGPAAWACGPSCRPHQAHTNKVEELRTK